jgi:hypothetical protein
LQVRRHLAGCGGCKTFVEEKSRLKRLVQSSVRDLYVPRYLVARVQELIRSCAIG